MRERAGVAKRRVSLQQLMLFEAPCVTDHPTLSIEGEGCSCSTSNGIRDAQHEGESHDA